MTALNGTKPILSASNAPRKTGGRYFSNVRAFPMVKTSCAKASIKSTVPRLLSAQRKLSRSKSKGNCFASPSVLAAIQKSTLPRITVRSKPLKKASPTLSFNSSSLTFPKYAMVVVFRSDCVTYYLFSVKNL